MSTRAIFKQSFAVQRNYGYPARQASELETNHHFVYRAAGFCAAERQQAFFGWVNDERWQRWHCLRMARLGKRCRANP
jgi:hypothetical protein